MNEKTNNNPKGAGLSIVNEVLARPAKDTVAIIKNAINEGEADPSYVGVFLKKFAKIQELVTEDASIKEQIHEQTILYQEGTSKTFKLHGAKITIANTSYWDYNTTEDPYLKALQEIEKQMKEMIKARKKEIQSKAAIHETKNNPKNIMDFGLKPFTITWDDMPKLIWEEGYGEVDTAPPTKRGKEILRYTV